MSEGRDCLFAGDLETGYIVAPHSPVLFQELAARCRATDRDPVHGIRVCQYSGDSGLIFVPLWNSGENSDDRTDENLYIQAK